MKDIFGQPGKKIIPFQIVWYGAPKGTHVEEKMKLNRAHDL